MNSEQDFTAITINAISFTCKDIASSDLFRNELVQFQKKLEGYRKENGYVDYGIKIIEPEYKAVFNSINRIKSIYLLIFAAIILMLTFLFYSLISYCQFKQKREIFIRFSLGQNKKDICVYYIILYILIAFPALVSGVIPGLELCRLLNKNFQNTSYQMMEELLRYSANGNYSHLSSGMNIVANPSMPIFVLVLIAGTLYILSLIIICAAITTSNVLSDHSQNNLRGGA